MENDLEVANELVEKNDVVENTSRIIINRPVYNQEQFSECYGERRLENPNVSEVWKRIKNTCDCSVKCLWKTALGCFPIFNTLRCYRLKKDLSGDIIAGLTVGIMQIPQGMAYAMLAGLDPVYGLYTSFFPVLIYFIFGTSRHVSLGTFAVVSLMVGSAVSRVCGKRDRAAALEEGPSATTATVFLSTEGFELNSTTVTLSEPAVDLCPIHTAVAVTFLGGLMQLCLGFLRLGFVVIYLSEPFTRGYTTGASMHVFTSQITAIFGVSVPRYSGPLKLIYTYVDFFRAIVTTNIATLIMSVVCIISLYLTKEYLNPPVKKRIKMPIPIDLIIVVVGTGVSAGLHFEKKYGMRVVGYIPTGLPSPTLPRADLFSEVISDAFIIAIVAFAISVSMAQLFGKKHNYPVDSNQELVAHGICNMVSCNFSCYMMCVSLSRSMVQDSVGGKTQVAGLVQALIVLVVILALAGLFQALPNCVLAAIIIVALKGLFMQFKDLRNLWKSSKWDWSVWLVTFTAVILLDVDLGLMVGVWWSFLTVVFRTQRPRSSLLGRISETDIYKDIDLYSQAAEIPGIKIFSFESPIYYANRNYFIEQLYHKTECNPKQIQRTRAKSKGKSNNVTSTAHMEDAVHELSTNPTHIIIDCSAMPYLDGMGIGALTTVIKELKQIGVTVVLACVKDSVKEMLVTGGFFEETKQSIIYISVHDAFEAIVHGD